MAKQPSLVPPPGKKVHLKDYDPAYSGDYKNELEARDLIEKDLLHLRELQDALYAERKHPLLVVLQGIDAGGKDGTINHVFRGLNPQGVVVTSFKQPTEEESAHDFLWRIHQHTPAKGYIAVFNRSHYEEVLVVRVHDLVPKKVWKARYDQINQFEEILAANGTTILKFFLYISRDEQKTRFEVRLHDPDKRWKFGLGDLEERKLWDDYQAAYEDMLSKCNTDDAPWTIVPANHKWYRNLVVTRTIVETLEKLDPKYPDPIENIDKIVIPD